MWPLSISYPCLVLILLVKYTVKWKMIALFIIKIKLYRPLKNNLDNFNFWYICFLSDYIFFSYYIWIIVHFHCIWICWVFKIYFWFWGFYFSMIYFLIILIDFYLHWKITTFKSQDLLKISFQNILHLSHGHAMENLPFEYLRERDLISVR